MSDEKLSKRVELLEEEFFILKIKQHATAQIARLLVANLSPSGREALHHVVTESFIETMKITEDDKQSDMNKIYQELFEIIGKR